MDPLFSAAMLWMLNMPGHTSPNPMCLLLIRLHDTDRQRDRFLFGSCLGSYISPDWATNQSHQPLAFDRAHERPACQFALSISSAR